MPKDRFERALGIAGAEYAQTLLGGEVRRGAMAGEELWIPSQVKPSLPWFKDVITRIEVTTSSLWLPDKSHSPYPFFRFGHLMRDVERVLLIGSMRLKPGRGTFSYPHGLVVGDTGPLIVKPWLFFFTLYDALEIGLSHNTADIIYTPFQVHKDGKWSRLLRSSWITPAKLSTPDCQL